MLKLGGPSNPAGNMPQMPRDALCNAGDVGNRPGALHDGGLRKSGKWQEVPLFTNCTIQREYTDSCRVLSSVPGKTAD